jgi:hypothetical protein
VYGSEDPDPSQNVADPEHCKRQSRILYVLTVTVPTFAIITVYGTMCLFEAGICVGCSVPDPKNHFWQIQ